MGISEGEKRGWWASLEVVVGLQLTDFYLLIWGHVKRDWNRGAKQLMRVLAVILRPDSEGEEAMLRTLCSHSRWQWGRRWAIEPAEACQGSNSRQVETRLIENNRSVRAEVVEQFTSLSLNSPIFLQGQNFPSHDHVVSVDHATLHRSAF